MIGLSLQRDTLTIRDTWPHSRPIIRQATYARRAPEEDFIEILTPHRKGHLNNMENFLNLGGITREIKLLYSTAQQRLAYNISQKC